MTAATRHFVEWDRPLLSAATAFLLERASTPAAAVVSTDPGPEAIPDSLFDPPPAPPRFGAATPADVAIDLGRVICVTPGRRAGRMLLHGLAEAAETRDVALIPPATLTPGVLLERLVDPSRPLATEAEAFLAWRAALLDVARPDLDPALARRLHEIDLELSAAMRTFADAADAATTLGAPAADVERWRALADIQRDQRRRLREHDRLHPAEALADARHHRRGAWDDVDAVIVIGAADLTTAQERLLDLLGDRVTYIVHAPPEYAPHFDAAGRPLPSYWNDARLDLEPDTVHFVDRPADQAQRTLDCLATVAPHAAVHDVTIALADEALGPIVRRHAARARVDVHLAAGRDLAQTRPYRLLQTLVRWRTERRFRDLAALVRHPDVERRLARRADLRRDWPAAMDRYFNAARPDRVAPDGWVGKDRLADPLRAVDAALDDMLGSFARGDGASLSTIAGASGAALASVYRGVRGLDPETAAACETLGRLLNAFADAAPIDTAATHPWTDGVELLLGFARGRGAAWGASDGAIDAVGWLELHLDPAPYAVLVGANEGRLPAAARTDGFLPESIRGRLGLADHARRLARDRYLLEATVRSRRRVDVIAGRESGLGDPLLPSRLLMWGEDGATCDRMKAFVDPPAAPLRRPWGAPAAPSAPGIPIPSLPDDLPPVTSMRVTDFRAYLTCPYRYALSRLLSLEQIEPPDPELPPRVFGTLTHDILQAFGETEAMRDETDAQRIEAFLFETLDTFAAERLGGQRSPLVHIQLARLQQRLVGFARQQADLRQAGWRIIEIEASLPEKTTLDIGDQPDMPIRGKIDRIDQHEQLGYRLIDYKTGETDTSPDKSHRERGEWTDLQLPLYAHLARRAALVGDGPIDVGYFRLGRAIDQVRWTSAGWSQVEIDEGVERARAVVRAIRAGDFEMNGDYSSFFDEFARICQVNVRGGDDDEGGDE